jgi:hypothetical protein
MTVMLTILDPRNPTPAREHVLLDALDEDALSVVDADGNCRRWIDQLLEQGYPDEALRLLTRALPRKYALAWGCEALRRWLASAQTRTREIDRAGVVLAERWLSQPTEDHRRAALEFAERGDFSTAGAWIAAAAAWAEGSLAPRDCDVVAPPETLTGEAVYAALMTAAFADKGAPAERIGEFVRNALQTFGGVAPIEGRA